MYLCTLQQHAFTNALHERVIWNLPRTIVCQTPSNTQVKQLLARCTNWTTKKYYYTHCTMKKHAKFHFRMKFCLHKNQCKILLARGLSIQQLSALGRWNVMLLLLLLLQEKCEYHRTCCDYLVAAACQDGSAWNERKKLQHFHQLILNMFWDLWKSYARTFRCLALLRWERTRARVQCELLLAGSFVVVCWTLNLYWYVLLGSSKKFTSRNHWITAFSQINGCYSSPCLSCPRKALH